MNDIGKTGKDELKTLQSKIDQLEVQLDHDRNLLKEMSEAENRYHSIFENAHDGIILHDPQGNIFDVNQNMYERLGYTKDEMLSMNLRQLVASEFTDHIQNRVKDLQKEGVATFESADLRKDGTLMYVEVSARLVKYQGKEIIQSIVRDIHERKLAENLISTALQDKKVLRSEIERCISLNQRINTLTYKKLASAHSQNIPQILEAARKRSQVLGFIQRKIYRYLNYNRINVKNLTQGLIRKLQSLYQDKNPAFFIHHECDRIILKLNQVLPCTIIIAELLTNAIRHAFDPGKKGQVHLKIIDKGTAYSLEVIDNGNGLPANLIITEPNSIGWQLVNEQVRELEGRLETMGAPGTGIIVRFPKRKQ